MTRDEHRAKCIDTMTVARLSKIDELICRGDRVDAFSVQAMAMAAAFDSLNSADARVNPIEPTPEMVSLGQKAIDEYKGAAYVYRSVSAAGDLTNLS